MQAVWGELQARFPTELIGEDPLDQLRPEATLGWLLARKLHSDKALALLAVEPVDAAVLDINLKGQMVFPVADALRERGIPFVFATGYDEAAVPEAYRDVPRWEKPFRPGDLAKALPAIVQKS